jgi:putative SOS response-associated peptidase YedK
MERGQTGLASGQAAQHVRPMCNLYSLPHPRDQVARIFDAIVDVDAAPVATDIYPRKQALVVRRDGSKRRMAAMTWGFPPPPSARAPVTNVRNLASPFWRSALANPAQRCLVPVARFCEWEGPPGAKVKRWFHIPSREIFAFAGLWRATSDGPVFAFLTCAPNPLVAAIHPKAMPVILHAVDHDRWLDSELADAVALAAPFPSQLMAVA